MSPIDWRIRLTRQEAPSPAQSNGRGNRRVRRDKRRLITAVLPVDPVVIEARSAEENLGGLGPGR
jgi:hypothetical protein